MQQSKEKSLVLNLSTKINTIILNHSNFKDSWKKNYSSNSKAKKHFIFSISRLPLAQLLRVNSHKPQVPPPRFCLRHYKLQPVVSLPRLWIRRKEHRSFDPNRQNRRNLRILASSIWQTKMTGLPNPQVPNLKYSNNRLK